MIRFIKTSQVSYQFWRLIFLTLRGVGKKEGKMFGYGNYWEDSMLRAGFIPFTPRQASNPSPGAGTKKVRTKKRRKKKPHPQD